jgi:hypothetical protein
LSLDNYFEKIDSFLNNPLMLSIQCNKEKRSSNVGLITGIILFIDLSELHFMEYLEVEGEIKKITYRYHYQNSQKELVFRYDNAPHYPKILSYPNHKHAKTKILESNIPTLQDVIEEIESKYLT